MARTTTAGLRSSAGERNGRRGQPSESPQGPNPAVLLGSFLLIPVLLTFLFASLALPLFW